jgi:hypothetical protein
MFAVVVMVAVMVVIVIVVMIMPMPMPMPMPVPIVMIMAIVIHVAPIAARSIRILVTIIPIRRGGLLRQRIISGWGRDIPR